MSATSMPTPERKSRLGSLIAGMGALASIWPPTSAPLRYPHQSEAEALRGDTYRIGRDMHRVIERERARLEAPSE